MVDGDRRQVRACLFDMDGLLIDSERIYTETTELILAKHGRPGPFPLDVKGRMMGRPGPEAARIFVEWAEIDGMTVDRYISEQRELQLTRFPHVQPMAGALALISRLHDNEVPIALATSSTSANFALKSTNLRHLFAKFGDAVICGDDDRVAGRGKPAPDIFLAALADLNRRGRDRDGDAHQEIMPDECLVFEDGVPGVEAGLAAGATVIWVPDSQIAELYKDRLDEILPSSKGERLASLEDFDYGKYGLA
ncbi:hypothetical protein PYCC9005_005048 [Savitreella phatthalungensis]